MINVAGLIQSMAVRVPNTPPMFKWRPWSVVRMRQRLGLPRVLTKHGNRRTKAWDRKYPASASLLRMRRRGCDVRCSAVRACRPTTAYGLRRRNDIA